MTTLLTTSFENFPNFIHDGMFKVSKTIRIMSLDGLDLKVTGKYVCEFSGLTNLKSFKNIHKHLDCTFLRLANMHVKSNILGLLMMPSLTQLEFKGNLYINNEYLYTDKEFKRALGIIDLYVRKKGSTVATKAMILEAQNALIDADLDDYADL